METMKTLYRFLFLMILIFVSCDKGDESKADGFSSDDKLPITTQAVWDAENVTLSIQPNAGFGIQIDAPNRLQAEPIGGLVIRSANLNFEGKPNPEKPEYYSGIKPMELVVEGKGSFRLTGKIFYCDYSKNICLPGKMDRVVSMQ